MKLDGLLEQRASYGNNITVIKKDEDCTIYEMKDTTGEGTMTCYKVFPGIDLMYNDFHMQNCFSKFIPKVEMMGIDHCREGRIEWEFQSGSYMYLQEGDLQINSRNHHAIGFGFPLKHYHGITVYILMKHQKPYPLFLTGFLLTCEHCITSFVLENLPSLCAQRTLLSIFFLNSILYLMRYV